METGCKILLIIAAICFVTGMILGGMIGHFATKSNISKVEEPSPRTGSYVDWQLNTVDKRRQFLQDEIDPSDIHDMLRDLSEKPRLAASNQSIIIGDWIADQWKASGLEIKKVHYDVLLSKPGEGENRNKAIILSSSGEVEFTDRATEEILIDVQNNSDVIPPFNAYAKAGNVKSNRVYYVNFCKGDDFQALKNLRINITGSIVICRYGGIFRGDKVKWAEQAGAIGVLLYTDPKDYVAISNETFPDSLSLPPSGVQRGTVFFGKGDPSTPGYPSKGYTFRRTAEENEEMPNIPTQPMGYGDAVHFMRELQATGSDEVPEDWRGNMNVTYKYGGALPSSRSIQIINNNQEVFKTITNVFGYIRGTEEPDRYVIVGNHRDSWAFGAADAASATAIMIDMSRAFSELMKTGWRPRRTIMFASWDAEEYGLIGSWEWCEDARSILTPRTVAYINCDYGVRYTDKILLQASPLLSSLILDALKKIPHPKRSEYDNLHEGWNRGSPTAEPQIDDLNFNTDHAGFFHKLGISSMNFGFVPDESKLPLGSTYPLYHTAYDTMEQYNWFLDSCFTAHQALGRLWSSVTISLADSPVIPFNTSSYAVRLQQACHSVEADYKTKLENQNFTKYLTELQRAVSEFASSSTAFDRRVKTVDQSNWGDLRIINDQMLQLERTFIFPLGVLDRRHVILSPSVMDPSPSSGFPGIRDSLYDIDDSNSTAWKRVEEELTKAIYVVDLAAKSLIDATEAF